LAQTVFNLLKNNVVLDQREIRLIRRHQKVLGILASKHITVGRKIKLLNSKKGAAALYSLLPTIIQVLKSLV